MLKITNYKPQGYMFLKVRLQTVYQVMLKYWDKHILNIYAIQQNMKNEYHEKEVQ